MYAIEFVVEGTGRFPVDMLRYDNCFPSSGNDAEHLRKLISGEYDGKTGIGSSEPYGVCLTKFAASKAQATPTDARWRSFGWTVTTKTTARKIA